LKSVLPRLGKIGQRYGAALASEGFVEEAGQTTGQNLFTEKASKGELNKGDNSYASYMTGGIKDFTLGEATDEYIKTLSSNEGQRAIFLGGMLGGAMMSHQGRRQDVRNQKNTNAILDGIDEGLLNFNTINDTDIYAKDENGGYIYKKNSDGTDSTEREINKVNAIKVMRALDYKEKESEQLELAIESGNSRAVEIIQERAILDLIAPAIHNGEAGLEALKTKLEESTKFQEIIARDSDSKSNFNSKEFVEHAYKEAKYLQEQNEKFKDFAKDVIKIEDKNASKDTKADFINNLNNRYLQVKSEQYLKILLQLL